MDVLDNFSNISGLKLNSSKCCILRAGRLTFSNLIFCRQIFFTWCSNHAKALGMVFNNKNDTDNTFSLNLLPKIDAFCNCLKQWQHRKLSLIG